MPRATSLSRDAEEEVDKAVAAVDVAVVDPEVVTVVTSEAVVTVKVVAVAVAAVLLSPRHRSSQSLRGTPPGTFWQPKHSVFCKEEQRNETTQIRTGKGGAINGEMTDI